MKIFFHHYARCNYCVGEHLLTCSLQVRFKSFLKIHDWAPQLLLK